MTEIPEIQSHDNGNGATKKSLHCHHQFDGRRDRIKRVHADFLDFVRFPKFINLGTFRDQDRRGIDFLHSKNQCKSSKCVWKCLVLSFVLSVGRRAVSAATSTFHEQLDIQLQLATQLKCSIHILTPPTTASILLLRKHRL